MSHHLTKRITIPITSSTHPTLSLAYTHTLINPTTPCSPIASQHAHTLWLLHGSYQTRHTYDDFMELFFGDASEKSGVTKQSVRYSPLLKDLVALDLRGHGESDYADAYDPKLISHDLYEFRKEKYRRELEEMMRQEEEEFSSTNTQHLSLDPKTIKEVPNAVIVGMSLGGLATLDHWVRYGTSLGGVIVDITPDNGAQRNEGMIALRGMKKKSLEEWVAWAKGFNPHRSEDSLRSRLQYSVGPNEDGHWVWRTDPKFSDLFERADSEYWNWLWKGLQELKPSSDQTQVLIIRGGRSNVTKPQDIEKLVRVMNEGCDREWVRSVEIEKAGHSVQGDAPEEFHKAVSDHLRRIYSLRTKL